MSILDPVKRESTAEDGAQQISRLFQQTFRQMEVVLRQVRDLVNHYGRADIEAVLGSDAKQLAALYAALKATVEQNKSGTTVPDLPT